MAELTLEQRSQMANNHNFQLRLSSALRKTANYWATFPLDTLPKYNKANKKKKEFARAVLSGSPISLVAYAEYLLSIYNEANPDLLPITEQVSDAVLTDSSASAQAYNYFAGVQPGDDTDMVEF